MNTQKTVVFAIALSFIFSSIVFAGGITAWSQDHAYRIGVWDAASQKGVRNDLPDSISFRDHSFREGVQPLQFDAVDIAGIDSSGVRGYYPESDMRRNLGITDEGRMLLMDGPAD